MITDQGKNNKSCNVDLLIEEGVSISVRRLPGEGRGVCVFIHGFGEGGYVWDEIAPMISLYSEVVLLDLRGHGNSSWDSMGSYHVDKYVSDVQKVINFLRLSEIILVGHSLGGEIVVRLYFLIHELVRAIILVDYSIDVKKTVKREILKSFKDQFKRYNTTAEYADRLRRVRPLISVSLSENLAVSALRTSVGGGFKLKVDPLVAADNAENYDKSDAINRLKKIICPVFLIRGVGSSVLPSHAAKEIIKNLPHGMLKVVDSAGHNVMLDNPQSFARLVVTFILQINEDF